MSRLAFSLKKNRILKLMRNIANRNYEIMQKYAQFNRDEFQKYHQDQAALFEQKDRELQAQYP